MKRQLKKLDLNIKSYLLNGAQDQDQNNRSKLICKFVQAWERHQETVKKENNTPFKESNIELEKSHPGFQIQNSQEKEGLCSQPIEIDEWVSYIITNNKKCIPKPILFEQSEDQDLKGLGKLLCFKFTNKNKVFVKFSNSSLTCKPVYQCYGCNKVFKSPSALGGHLSRCQDKKYHFRMIERLRKSSSIQDELSKKKEALRNAQKKSLNLYRSDQNLIDSKGKYRLSKQQEISEEQS